MKGFEKMAKPRPAKEEEVKYAYEYAAEKNININNCEIRISGAGNIVCRDKTTSQDILMIPKAFIPMTIQLQAVSQAPKKTKAEKKIEKAEKRRQIEEQKRLERQHARELQAKLQKELAKNLKTATENINNNKKSTKCNQFIGNVDACNIINALGNSVSAEIHIRLEVIRKRSTIGKLADAIRKIDCKNVDAECSIEGLESKIISSVKRPVHDITLCHNGKLIDKQSNDRQRFIITKEAASLGIEAKSQKTISEKECKAVISSFASEYINKIEKNNYRLPSEELTTSKCTQLSSALSPQEVFEQVIQKINANKNITENIKNKAINNLLEDAAFYNKTLQKEIIDISDLKKIQEKISKPKETQNETKGHIFSNEISKNAPQNTTEPAKMKSIISNDDMAKKHAENFNKESKNAAADFINDIKNYTPKEQEEIVKKIDKDIKNDARIAKAFIDAVKESKISTDTPECNKIVDNGKSDIENEEQEIEEQGGR